LFFVGITPDVDCEDADVLHHTQFPGQVCLKQHRKYIFEKLIVVTIIFELDCDITSNDLFVLVANVAALRFAIVRYLIFF
jgi:hypothetical protein